MSILIVQHQASYIIKLNNKSYYVLCEEDCASFTKEYTVWRDGYFVSSAEKEIVVKYLKSKKGEKII